MCAGAGRKSRFRRQVPEGSGRFRCVLVWVPEAGSGRFRKVPVCAGVGSGGRFRKVPVCAGGVGSGGKFRKVPEGSGVWWCRLGGRFRKVLEGSGVCWCRLRRQVPEAGSGVCWWCRFRRQVPDGSGGFRCLLVYVPEAGSGRFWRVPVCAGRGSGGRFRTVPEGSGVCWCRFRRQVPKDIAWQHHCFQMSLHCLVRLESWEGSVVEAGSGRFRRLRKASGRFRRVPVCAGVGSGDKFRKAPEGSGAEQECAHVVKHGKRLPLLGIPPKLIVFFHHFEFWRAKPD